MVRQIDEIEYKNSEKKCIQVFGWFTIWKKSYYIVHNLSNARWIKYLNVEKEFIRVAEENIGKYLNNIRSTKCVCVFKKEQSQKP